MKQRLKLTATLLLFLLLPLIGQQKIRVMSYNILNYPNSHDADFKKIVSHINPDAILVQEMLLQSGVNQFLNNALSAEYSAATVIIKSSDAFGNNGNDCAFYYKKAVLTLLESKEIPARTRVISQFKLVHNITKDTIIILGVHLKANDYNSSDNNLSNETKRASAVQSLRSETIKFSPKTNYLICGDFNIFYSTEPAMIKLTDKSSAGYFIDILNATGSWSDNPNYASISTHSAFKLDTRLDMILVGPTLIEKGGVDYIENSFKTFGNDGNHFNQSVNSGANYWFATDASLGNAVLYASDHLPIYADFNFGVATNLSESELLPASFELLQNYPNPFNPSTQIKYKISLAGFVSLKVYDVLGNEVASLVNEFKQPGNYSSFFTLNSSLSSGVYFYTLRSVNYNETKKMIMVK